MTDKKTTKTEKPAEKKQPSELSDAELDSAQGAASSNHAYQHNQTDLEFLRLRATRNE